MTATNSSTPAKDGTATSFTLATVAESVSGFKANKTYIAEPAGETLITPALETGGNLASIKTNTAITAAGTPATSGLPVQGMTGGVPVPVSAASLPLPSGAAQDGTDGTGITPPTGAVGIRGWLSGIFNKLNTSIIVTGTFWQTTQPVSTASLPLPTGAATSALQTTINTTLGSPMQASGSSVTANAGTNLNTSALALETGGNLATVATAQGAGGTGIAQPTGGSGILGFLSGCYSTLLSILTAATNPLPAGSLATDVGSTGISQTTPGTSNNVVVTSLVTPASETSNAAATGIASAIPAVAGKYSYIAGLMISGLGATSASVIVCNITNVLSSNASSNTWQFWINIPAGVTVPINGGVPIILTFNPPLQGKAVNTQVQCNVPSFGAGNTQQQVAVWGYNSPNASFMP